MNEDVQADNDVGCRDRISCRYQLELPIRALLPGETQGSLGHIEPHVVAHRQVARDFEVTATDVHNARVRSALQEPYEQLPFVFQVLTARAEARAEFGGRRIAEIPKNSVDQPLPDEARDARIQGLDGSIDQFDAGGLQCHLRSHLAVVMKNVWREVRQPDRRADVSWRVPPTKRSRSITRASSSRMASAKLT